MKEIINFKFLTDSQFLIRKLENYRFIGNSKFVIRNSPHKRGFTLPELLIVMAVIAGLAALTMTTYPATQKRARDTRRRSDVKQYQTAMEVYYNKNDQYTGTSGNLASLCTPLGLGTNCPDDPLGGTNHYRYFATSTSYVFYTALQLPKPPPTTYFVVCSNGKVGEMTSAPGSANCPLP